MHTRRLAAFLLGGWIAGSIFMVTLVITNLRAANSAFQGTMPEPVHQMLQNAGLENVRMLVQFHASEMTRTYLSRWELLQIVLGIGFLFVLVFATHTRRAPLFFGGMMVVLVAFLHFFIAPELAYIGRQLDFVPRDSNIDLRLRLWMLTQVYFVLDAVKVLIGLGLAAYLFYFRSRRHHRAHSEADEPVSVVRERRATS
jgi:hypothetical protein